MSSNLSFRSRASSSAAPFSSCEEAWFWFVLCHQATHDGARIVSGQGSVPRPCEPIDILCCVETLSRRGDLSTDHLRVLAIFGGMQMAPDAGYPPHKKDARLWREAHEKLEPIFLAKGIVEPCQTLDYQGAGGHKAGPSKTTPANEIA